MQEQNYANHVRRAPLGFYAAALIGLAILVLSVIQGCGSCEKGATDCWTPFLFHLGGWGLLLAAYFSRMFALKAQDRAIRAEETLRFFMLTGQRPDRRLTLQQWIALRFASDEEFPDLCRKAAEENLSSKAIKTQIKNWRADHHRV